MLTILLRKMMNTKWMVLCLFAGFLMAAGMMCTIPIYMDASLQRMLIKDMEEFQLQTGSFPGEYNIYREVRAGDTPEYLNALVDELPAFASARVKKVGIPVSSEKVVLLDSMLYLMKGAVRSDVSVARVKMTAMTDFAGHITLTDGEMYAEGGVGEDGVIEVLVTDVALKTLEISVGGVYEIKPSDTSKEGFRIRVTGTFAPDDEKDIYWAEKLDVYLNAFVTDYGCYTGNLMKSGAVSVSEVWARYGLAYQKLDMNALSSVTGAIEADKAACAQAGYGFKMEIYDILLAYVGRAASLTRVLWALQIPVMFMLGFYLFMVSELNMEREKAEIAVFKSRGAGSGQVFALYAGEAGVLGIAAFLTAPLIGLSLCRFLGVSNGFLEFVNRRGLTAKITGVSLIYALLAVVIFFAATVIPVIPASRLSIVGYIQNRAKSSKTPLWEKTGIDFMLIIGSLTALYFYRENLQTALNENYFSATGEIDPLLFILATFLIMGLGLLYIRVYPYLLRLLHKIGGRFWTPSQYIAVTTVSRGRGADGGRYLMMFLVITFSLGLFSANTARTINNNKSDMLYYSNGTDVTLKEYWLESRGEEDIGMSYTETDFEKYESLAGVEIATKVLRGEAKLGVSKNAPVVTLMAIEPDKFAKTAWFRGDLLPVHWWNYCNALVQYRSGVIISQSLSDNTGFGLGDEISLKWGGNAEVNATIIAIVGWWAGINPYENENGFAVMNYNYIRSQTELEPYEIWLKMEKGASSQALYDDIKAKHLPIQTLTDSSQLLIQEKTQPQLQGMNGALTLGFVIIMVMTVIGFLIYWILSIKGRALQFGVLRAMGMSTGEIIASLGYEQLLVSGVSVFVAFIIGGIASDLFVPLFQNMYALNEQIPPFYVVAAQSDYIKIYIIIAVMLALGFAVLGGLVKRLNINKALKLGED